ncbi:MAG: hypothetical protein IJ393_01865 [Clostridia bacterium]|nr:hypothetical protein [Clostridia bacterium]
MDNENKFEYRYAAPTEAERKKVESLRREYLNETVSEGKIERLKRLDNKVKQTPMIFGLTLGIIGTLIFGLGLAMILEWEIRVWGTLVAFVGLVPVCLAYPLYKKIFALQKKKYGAEIIRLSDEILNEEK